ncbi:MAG: hypothetical protein Q7R35_04980 [Elusimicrobiota bacterium]|nr:hypothetical protein [Elusimicrobiota bacterium]
MVFLLKITGYKKVAATFSRTKACLLGGVVAVLFFGVGRLFWFAAWDIPQRISGCSGFFAKPKECLAPGEEWNNSKARESAEKRSRSHWRWRTIMLPIFFIAGILLIPAWIVSSLLSYLQPGFLWYTLAIGLYFIAGMVIACLKIRRAKNLAAQRPK